MARFIMNGTEKAQAGLMLNIDLPMSLQSEDIFVYDGSANHVPYDYARSRPIYASLFYTLLDA